MSDILLSTLNARYSHASLGLRCLRANLGSLHKQSAIKEFVIGQKTEEIAEAILNESPKILGLGVYIWNCEESLKLVLMLKAIRPDLIIILGGPEVNKSAKWLISPFAVGAMSVLPSYVQKYLQNKHRQQKLFLAFKPSYLI